jgi:hypothetical protein
MDAAVAFAPFFGLSAVSDSKLSRVVRKTVRSNSAYARHRIYDYATVVQDNLDRPIPQCKVFPGVSPGFDNSPRRPADATILKGSTPALYEQWVRKTVERFEPYSAEENLVFVNAWNEWAEGNHLEPDRRWGHGYLEAHARASR